MTNATVLISSFPDKWGALFSLDQPLGMGAFLKSDLLATHQNVAIQFSITVMVCGLISFIASSLLALYILRSRAGLSSTYHRLMFALSSSDIMVQSFACAIIIPMIPILVSIIFGITILAVVFLRPAALERAAA